MSIWSKIFNLIYANADADTVIATTTAEKIILYVDDLINRKELSSGCSSLYEESRKKQGKEKDSYLVKTYLCYEKFITENKPLVVKKSFSKKSLRDEIIKNFEYRETPLDFKIIFLPPELQLLEIFKIASLGLFSYFMSNIGFETTKKIFLKNTEKNILSKLIFFQDNGLVIKEFIQQDIDKEELVLLLKNLFDTLKREIDDKFGKKIVEEIINETYFSFKDIYSFEFLQIFLQITPEGLLTNEKIRILAREELERKLSGLILEEKKKRETTEELASELQRVVEELNSSKAATLNLLEDLSKEKEFVEEEVNKRTNQLREEKALLKSTVESLPLSFFSVDNDFKLLDYNASLAKIISLVTVNNFSEIEEKIKPFFPIKDKCKDVLAANKPITIKEVHIKEVSYKIYLVPVRDEDEQTLGVLCLLEDITEQKIMERSRDEFFSIASHELRTPLTAIRGNASMILEFFLSSLPSKDVEQMVKDIHDASIRLIKIVSEFLDVSKLEQEKIIFRKEDVDMGTLLQEVFREFETLAISRNLSLKISPTEGDSFHVIGDRDRLKQIIANLLSNAINYTHEGYINLSLKKEDKKVVLYVKDTGVGISKENQNLLFRKFQQAQEKILTRDITRSTGLGLYISKLLAEAMGGRVELFESEEGRGSTFRLVVVEKL